MNNDWIIWLFEGITIGAALLILFSNSVFHAALNLLIAIVCLGIIFGLYGSEFLFITQIMIYGGGILVLILFATMVSTKDKSIVNTEDDSKLSIPVFFASAGTVMLAVTYIDWVQPRGVPMVVTTKELGTNLLVEYALPLEISGILLLASLIGAVIISIQKPTEA